MEYGRSKDVTIIAQTTTTGYAVPIICREYTTMLLDVVISSTGGVSFEAKGGFNYGNILGTFLDGTTASSSFVSASKLVRFNLVGCDAFRLNVTTLSVGFVAATGTFMVGGTALST